MDYKIRRAEEQDWEPAMELCWKTFLKFEAPIYDKEGSENFLKFISGNELYRMFLAGEYALWVAENETGIIGTASLRSQNHISLLFVDERYHRKGIGSGLISAMQQYAFEQNGKITLTVNSSPYGEKFYRKLGFTETDLHQKADGIIYLPMTLVFRV